IAGPEGFVADAVNLFRWNGFLFFFFALRFVLIAVFLVPAVAAKPFLPEIFRAGCGRTTWVALHNGQAYRFAKLRRGIKTLRDAKGAVCTRAALCFFDRRGLYCFDLFFCQQSAHRDLTLVR